MSANHILADLGNSAIKLTAHYTMHHTATVTLRWCDGNLDEALLAAWCERVTASKTWYVASVVPAKTKLLTAWLSEHRPQDTLRLITYSDVSMRVAVTSPAQLGIDRLLAAFAATQHLGTLENVRSLLVVDAGTALTIDVVRIVKKVPVFVGGAICLGMAPSLAALHTHTAQLPHITPAQLFTQQAKAAQPAKSTQAALIAGTMAQCVGAITLLHKQEVSHSESSTVPIILTGGDAVILEVPLREACGSTIILRPDLVLEGVAIIADQLGV